MWMTLFFLTLILAYIIIRKNSNKNLEGKEIPKVPSLLAIYSVITGPRVEVVENIPDEYYESGIYKLRIGLFDFYTITSADLAKKFLAVPEEFAPKYEFSESSPVFKFFGKGIVFSNGDKWRTHRKLSNVAFNRSMSAQAIGEVFFDAIDYVKDYKPVDVYELLQRVTIETLGKVAFGHSFGTLKSEELPSIIQTYRDISKHIGKYILYMFPILNVLPLKQNKIFDESIKDFDQFIFKLIEYKTKELKKRKTLNDINQSDHEELLISMIEASEQENLIISKEDLRDNITNFFSAGNDTTSMALSSSLYYLAKDPKMQERARKEVINVIGNELKVPTSEQLKELKYLNAIIKESLRKYPAPLTFRKLKKTLKLGEYILPENSNVRVSNYFIHHDAKYWDNPFKFDPERWLDNGRKPYPSSYIPFSSGNRNCVGQNFSVLEQRIFLVMFLLKFEWSLPKDTIHKDDLVLSKGYLFKPKNLKIIFKERI